MMLSGGTLVAWIPMRPAGVHHVSICVSDADEALVFYRDVLGCSPLPRPDLGPGHWLDAGGQQVHLMQSDEPPPRSNHFAFRVDDLDAVVDELRSKGVDVHPVPHVAGAGRQAFLHDPFGNFLELNQPDA
jgi:catechol 2,3-dioxygenase-like lactoylglutathione lyase family enzyme